MCMFALPITQCYGIWKRVVTERLNLQLREQKRQAAVVLGAGGDAAMARICGRDVRPTLHVRLLQKGRAEGQGHQRRAALRAGGAQVAHYGAHQRRLHHSCGQQHYLLLRFQISQAASACRCSIVNPFCVNAPHSRPRFKNSVSSGLYTRS